MSPSLLRQECPGALSVEMPEVGDPETAANRRRSDDAARSSRGPEAIATTSNTTTDHLSSLLTTATTSPLQYRSNGIPWPPSNLQASRRGAPVDLSTRIQKPIRPAITSRGPEIPRLSDIEPARHSPTTTTENQRECERCSDRTGAAPDTWELPLDYGKVGRRELYTEVLNREHGADEGAELSPSALSRSPLHHSLLDPSARC